MRRAMAFLTPIGRASVPDLSSFLWFPLVGAVIGAALGSLWWVLALVWPPDLAAALVVVADLGITGMLHFDGLVDSADGLLPPHVDRARRLDAMRDPAAGAFGTTAAAAALVVRWASLAAIDPSPLLLAGIWATSRTLMAVVALSVPYARSGGLASAFVDRLPGATSVSKRTVRAVAAGSGAGLAAVGCLIWHPLAGGVVVVAECVAGGAVVWFACRKIGGFTGDVLGAAGVVGETVALVVAAARW